MGPPYKKKILQIENIQCYAAGWPTSNYDMGYSHVRRSSLVSFCVLHIVSWCYTFLRNFISGMVFSLQSGHEYQGSFPGAISRYSRIFLQEIASKFQE